MQQRGDTSPGHTGLQNTRLAVGALDAVGAIAHQQVIDLVLIPEGQPGLLLVVETSGGDDVQSGTLGDFPHQPDIPAQVDGGTIHYGANTHGSCLVQHTTGHFGYLVSLVEPWTEVHSHGPVGTGQVFMHQHLAQIGCIYRSQYTLDLHLR